MVSKIPPKARETAPLSYYTKGEMTKEISPAPFKSHIAEPGYGAGIIQRNPCHYEDMEIKPKAPFIRTGGYTPGLYAGRSEAKFKEPVLSNVVSSLSEAKIVKKREYAE